MTIGCGRSPIELESGGTSTGGPPLPTTTSGVDGSDGLPITDDGARMDLPPPVPCLGTMIFADGFEPGPSYWALGSRWTVTADSIAYAGLGALRGVWGDFDVGCPVQSAATLTFELDLRDRSSAALEFQHLGSACEYDELWVSVTVPGAAPTVIPVPAPDPNEWTLVTADLSPWLDYPAVTLAVGFDNVCGDPCGVDWRIDEFRVCAED